MSTSWKDRPEGGGKFALWVAELDQRRGDRGVARLLLDAITLYFLVRRGPERNASRQWLGRALGRPATLWDAARHVHTFASTILDRVFMLGENTRRFDVAVTGLDALHAELDQGRGMLLFGSHLGSFEVLRAVGRGRAGLPVAMLMYEENARKINATLEAINPAATEDIIALGRMDSMLQARDRLDQGYLVGMLADRRLGDDPVATCDFLGAPAAFPLGPFRMAAMLQRPVFFMTGLYLGGNRYRIHFEPLADFSQVERADRDEAIRAAIDRYASRLEYYCRLAPYNWFNFFDFWQGAAAPNER